MCLKARPGDDYDDFHVCFFGFICGVGAVWELCFRTFPDGLGSWVEKKKTYIYRFVYMVIWGFSFPKFGGLYFDEDTFSTLVLPCIHFSFTWRYEWCGLIWMCSLVENTTCSH